MSSEIILNNGLIKALEFETKQMQKSGLYHISLKVTGNCVFLDAHVELVLFRIAQEALNNIIKHAAASLINIELAFNKKSLQLIFKDNGKGFNFENNNVLGTGLVNMKKRANTLNGNLLVLSRPGVGTEINIEIPINE